MTSTQLWRITNAMFRVAAVLFVIAGLIAGYRHRLSFAAVDLAIGVAYIAISAKPTAPK